MEDHRPDHGQEDVCYSKYSGNAVQIHQMWNWVWWYKLISSILDDDEATQSMTVPLMMMAEGQGRKGKDDRQR